MVENMNEESNDFLVNYFVFLQEFVKYFGYLLFTRIYKVLVVVVTCIR